MDLGLLAAFYVRVPRSRHPVVFPPSPNHDRLFHIPGTVPKSRRDGKVSSFHRVACAMRFTVIKKKTTLQHDAIYLYWCIPCEGFRPHHWWDIHHSLFLFHIRFIFGSLLNARSSSIPFRTSAVHGQDSLCLKVQQACDYFCSDLMTCHISYRLFYNCYL